MINVSVIIPAFNAELYIRNCLDSILLQDYREIEIIVVDDGSTDSTSQICLHYQQKDARLKYFFQENSGVSVARNVGIDMAKGRWLIFADADDMMEKNAIRHLVGIAESSCADAALGSLNLLQKGSNNSLYKKFDDSENAQFLPLKHPALWGYVFKSSLIKENGVKFVPGLAFSEDRVFLYECAKLVRKFVTTSKGVYAYRENETSVCKRSSSIRKFIEHIKAAASLKQILNKGDLSDSMKINLIREIKFTTELGFHLFVYTDNYDQKELLSAKECFLEYGGHILMFKLKMFYWRFRFFMRKIKSLR